jgi:hypothetical protein
MLKPPSASVFHQISDDYAYYQCMLLGVGSAGTQAADDIHSIDDIGIIGTPSDEVLTDPYQIIMLFIIGTADDLAGRKSEIGQWLKKSHVSICLVLGAISNDPELAELTSWLDAVIPTKPPYENPIEDIYWKMRLLARVENPGGMIHLTAGDIVHFFRDAGIVQSARFVQLKDETLADTGKRIATAESLSASMNGFLAVSAVDQSSSMNDFDNLTASIRSALTPETAIITGFAEETIDDPANSPNQFVVFTK